MNITQQTQLVKSTALQLGFDFCGISKAEFLEEEAPRLEQWLNKNMNGNMAYMQNYFDKRLDPRLLVDDAKSVISLLFNYYPEKQQPADLLKVIECSIDCFASLQFICSVFCVLPKVFYPYDVSLS